LTTLVAGVDGICRIRSDGSLIYFMTPHAIERVGLEGGGRSVIATGRVLDFAVDDAYVYWFTSEHPLADGAELMRAPKSGGVPRLLATYEQAVRELVVAGGRIYSLTPDGVFAVPKKGGSPKRVTRSVGYPKGLAILRDTLYFSTNRLPGRILSFNALLRAPTAGGAATVVLWGDFGVDAVAADDDGIFWSTSGDEVGLVRTANLR
jgi:hypothetical protein